MKVCAECQSEFVPASNRQVYCSERCRFGVSPCEACGKEFVRYRTKGRFCSLACFYGQPASRTLKPIACAHCATTFQPRQSTTRFCSRRCVVLAMVKVPRAACAACGGAMPGNARPSARYCSKPCAHSGRVFVGSRRVPLGARRVNDNGYVMVKVGNGPEVARSRKWRPEHRVVMEATLGRALAKHEAVHHLNGDRADNRPENLELWHRQHPQGVRRADLHCGGCRCQDLAEWPLGLEGGALTVT